MIWMLFAHSEFYGGRRRTTIARRGERPRLNKHPRTAQHYTYANSATVLLPGDPSSCSWNIGVRTRPVRDPARATRARIGDSGGCDSRSQLHWPSCSGARSSARLRSVTRFAGAAIGTRDPHRRDRYQPGQSYEPDGIPALRYQERNARSLRYPHPFLSR